MVRMSLESWLLQIKIIPFLRKDPFLSLLWMFLRQNNSTSLKNKRKESTKRSTLFMVITTSREKKQSRKKYEKEKVTADIISKLLILHRFLSRLTNWRLYLRLHTSSSSSWSISEIHTRGQFVATTTLHFLTFFPLLWLLEHLWCVTWGSIWFSRTV